MTIRLSNRQLIRVEFPPELPTPNTMSRYMMTAHKPMMLTRAVDPRLSIPSVTRGPSDQLVRLLVETLPGSNHVNDHVPDALEGKDDGAGQVEREVGAFGVHEGVDAVDT